ncbi:MAG TPA: hypothetical protein VFH06_03040 [Candidatus Saccharimonadales bacterium]|nr:hypothetical protein [Candidatus Saccharimonadales bacterium]
MGTDAYIDDENTATKQAVNCRDEQGKFLPGNKPKAGFHTNPERRSNGSWKREDTARYKLEKMMQLTDPELEEVVKDPATPTFERKLAEAIQKSEWKELDQMMNQVYGRKTDVDLNVQGEGGPPLIKGFVLPTIDPSTYDIGEDITPQQ